MIILALDLGTHTGYCYNNPDGSLTSGTWHLTDEKSRKAAVAQRLQRRRDPRIRRFSELLKALPVKPDLVVFEDVEFSSSTYQVQLWASFRSAAWLSFSEQTIFDCIPVASLKKFATGYGSADKSLMRKFLLAKHPEYDKVTVDDNEIDAIWLYLWANKNLSRMAV